MNNLLEVLDTKSKGFENTVSIITTGAAAGIAIGLGKLITTISGDIRLFTYIGNIVESIGWVVGTLLV